MLLPCQVSLDVTDRPVFGWVRRFCVLILVLYRLLCLFVCLFVSGYGTSPGFANPGPRQGESSIFPSAETVAPHLGWFLLISFGFNEGNSAVPGNSLVPSEPAGLQNHDAVSRGSRSEEQNVSGFEQNRGDWVPLLPSCREKNGSRPAVLPPGREVKSLDPVIKASGFGATAPLNEEIEHLAAAHGEREENRTSTTCCHAQGVVEDLDSAPQIQPTRTRLAPAADSKGRRTKDL